MRQVFYKVAFLDKRVCQGVANLIDRTNWSARGLELREPSVARITRQCFCYDYV